MTKQTEQEILKELRKISQRLDKIERKLGIDSQINKANKDIGNCLIKLGISPSWRGYVYLKDAIELFRTDKKMRGEFIKEIYSKVAEKNNVKMETVQTLMHDAIKKGLPNADKDFILEVFNINGIEKITSSKLIVALAEYIER